MSLFNRFVEIYIYNANGLLVCKMMQDMYIKQIEEAKEVFDGEKELEFEKELKKITLLKKEYYDSILYIECEVIDRLSNNELLEFLKTVKDVDNRVFGLSDGGNQKKL